MIVSKCESGKDASFLLTHLCDVKPRGTQTYLNHGEHSPSNAKREVVKNILS